jgi:hypothetical protein
LIAAALALVGAGCSNAAREGTACGSVVISFPSSLGKTAKTVLPDFASLIDTISATASATGEDSRSQSASGASGTIAFVGLPVGAWTISVSAIRSGVAIGSGSASVEIRSGTQASLLIPIYFDGFASGAGYLALPLSWPSSTGVDYLAWAIDGGSPSTATVSTASGASSTTLSASLSAGAHSLSLAFKRGGSGGTSAGTFTEAVDVWAGLSSGAWIDGAGSVRGAMTFAAGDFLESNANLGGLELRDGSVDGQVIDIGFSSTSTAYTLSTLPPSRRIVLTPTASVEGQYIRYSWNGGAAVELPSGSASGVLALDGSSYVNSLSILVRAPDKESVRSYAVAWQGAAASVGVSIAVPSYANLTFSPSAPSVELGKSLTITALIDGLSGLGSGWEWYIDGTAATEGTGSLTLGGEETAELGPGSHFIAAAAERAGIGYSGSLILTISR